MSRKHTDLADGRVKSNLEALISSADASSVPQYKEAMTALGRDLGRMLQNEVESAETTYVAFTVEDADFLAKGLMDELTVGNKKLAGVACFWNARSVWGEVKTTPIVKEYKERPAGKVKTLVVVKSIISSACVVKTNLTNLIADINPDQIHIASPVMFHGSESLLKKEFSDSVSSKFNFFAFAVDDRKESNGNVIPGIGGSVYEKLGFGDDQEKNKYIPTMVKERRLKFG